MSAYNCNVLPVLNNTAGVNAYVMSEAQVNKFLSYIWSDTFIQSIGKLFADPIDGVIRLQILPYNFNTQSIPEEPIKIGNATPDSTVTGYRTVGAYPDMWNMDQFANVVFRLGSAAVPEHFGNYLDNAPYTTIDLWLPYIGFTALDVDLVMGKNIAVDYAIDIVTGECSCFVKLVDEVDPTPAGYMSLNGEVIQTLNGRMAIEIPVNANNRNELAKNMLATGFSLVGGAVAAAATGGVGAGVAAGLITGTVTKALGTEMHIQKGQLGNGYAYWTAPQVPYMIISRPIPAEPSNYAQTVGRPSGKTARLGSLTGFTKISEIHLDGFGSATVDEINGIETLLKKGVIL